MKGCLPPERMISGVRQPFMGLRLTTDKAVSHIEVQTELTERQHTPLVRKSLATGVASR